jgi:hypothetical protein
VFIKGWGELDQLGKLYFQCRGFAESKTPPSFTADIAHELRTH